MKALHRAVPQSPPAVDLDGIGKCGIAEDVASMELGRPLTVSEVGHLVGLGPHTLRWYEQIGLVTDVPRDLAGRRAYSVEEIEWLLLLVRLRATGMPVKDMARYAQLVREGDSTVATRAELLSEHRDRLVAHIAKLQADLGIIDQKIEGYGRVVHSVASSA